VILEIIITVLSISTCFISYLFVLSLRRINQYENFIIQLQQIVEFATEKMKTVDASGHYKSDDETGFFFEQLKELQTLLNNIFELEEETSDKENKEKK
tara:strand:+ start:46 stop:339 length:294 start_codon:yes stop_codon:yes gene_type:complete